ncbi:MAG: hypothetical protein ACP5H9_05060 [Candidatus Woesearchaeota archaeon]
MPEKILEEFVNKEFSEYSSKERNEILRILKETMPLNLPMAYLSSENKEDYLKSTYDNLKQKKEDIESGEKRNFLEKGFDVRNNARILGYLFLMHRDYEKATDSFNLSSDFKVEEGAQKYYILLSEKNRERISNVLKEFYSRALSQGYEPRSADEIYKNNGAKKIPHEGKDKKENNKEGIKCETLIGTGFLIVAIASGTIGYKIMEKKFENRLKEEGRAYEQQIQELKNNLDSQTLRNSELEKQILELLELKDKPVYVVTMLGKDETITHKIAEYLDLSLGKYYDEMSASSRIKLINDFTRILYNIEENSRVGLTIESTRNLPENFFFYIPVSKVETKKIQNLETWVLTGKYKDLNGIIKEYKFSVLDY